MKQHNSTKKLAITLAITFFIFFCEVIGGIISNSLALLSDAGHVFTDAFALILSLVASVIIRKPSGGKATYGYQRIGILAAFINGLSLLVIAGFIIFEGYQRLIQPPQIDASVMLPVAVFGLVGNISMALILGHKHEDLNIKSAWLHIIGDTLSSLAVIIAGLIIKYTGWLIVDTIISGFVGTIIIIGGIRVVKESLWIFMEFVPKGFDVEAISKRILQIEGITDIHDIHIWSIGHGMIAFSAHIVINDCLVSEADKIRKTVEDELFNLGIKHSVIQIEACKCENSKKYCDIGKYLKAGHN